MCIYFWKESILQEGFSWMTMCAVHYTPLGSTLCNKDYINTPLGVAVYELNNHTQTPCWWHTPSFPSQWVPEWQRTNQFKSQIMDSDEPAHSFLALKWTFIKINYKGLLNIINATQEWLNFCSSLVGHKSGWPPKFNQHGSSGLDFGSDSAYVDSSIWIIFFKKEMEIYTFY